ncbi:thioredoxin domain-containing protein [Asticcacaulis taihuensis]|jgi:protein-disulfide isomerase|uniref:Thioredoxin n=1 Tax=Asticcacaulis taihuensis TaxID=260084 RepID=A0A1G4Q7Y1_9CAUL|nr:thioredoxin domain-containing protein [Asticcacaulis taihuensis]SCW40592.1 Thioredoxin [Asticcacaulis taihuensis]
MISSRRTLLALTTTALLLAGCGKTIKPVEGDMSLGAGENAKVTLIEYASVTCAHCAEFNKDVMPELMAKYITPGKIRYVYREFLTEPRDVSAAGILLARCSGKENYFKVVDEIMKAQGEMFGDGTTTNALPVLKRIGASVGIKDDAFNKCITDEKGLARIQDNVDKYLKEDDITGTPTFFINGKRFERKTGTIADFDEAFAPLLAGK